MNRLKPEDSEKEHPAIDFKIKSFESSFKSVLNEVTKKKTLDY
jgi:hypothetical protein